VLRGAVEAHTDGTYTVTSDAHKDDILNECHCKDSRTRYCKHYVAMLLWQRAQAQL
jgi:hypothetical protein